MPSKNIENSIKIQKFSEQTIRDFDIDLNELSDALNPINLVDEMQEEKKSLQYNDNILIFSTPSQHF